MSENILTKMLDSLSQTAALAFQYGIQDNSEIESCKHLALKLCHIESATKQHKKALSKASAEETLDGFDEAYAGNIKVMPISAASQSTRYKAFETQLAFVAETIHNNRDESFSEASQGTTVLNDDIEMGEVIPDIDPITKRPIEKPCRNIVCQHIYDLESMKQALQTAGRMRCPVVGCVNKKRIALEDLVEDPDLQRKLFIQRSRQRR